jgi:hypothetical protein
MKKSIEEYGTDLEGVKKAWDWAQQKVIIISQYPNVKYEFPETLM